MGSEGRFAVTYGFSEMTANILIYLPTWEKMIDML